ncbi:hypothetical protein T03_16412 [Trichinella britovi]|uniref:Uncharacterized protein n=1 Tax=Trichinella britovi TaxID=45882 RepID=A0A0V0YUH0_TRIBR|nr:hypothetical protein T03_16412 [Trichinella britovi]
MVFRQNHSLSGEDANFFLIACALLPIAKNAPHTQKSLTKRRMMA